MNQDAIAKSLVRLAKVIAGSNPEAAARHQLGEAKKKLADAIAMLEDCEMHIQSSEQYVRDWGGEGGKTHDALQYDEQKLNKQINELKKLLNISI